MLRELYDLRGWDSDGVPLKRTAERLGLSGEYARMRETMTEVNKTP
jgi:aldehyde:ferredoxin oxidoreductase